MGRKTIELGVIVAVVAVAVIMFGKTGPTPEPSPSPAATETTLVPLEGKTGIPELTEEVLVLVKTDAGPFTLVLYPQAGPRAVERFLQLVDLGFYNNTPVSRVVENFVVQFGINSKMADWKDKHFEDDESFFQMRPGTLAFAKAGPNTNSTQVFINLATNNQLAEPSLNFSVFGQVVEGMEVVEKFRQVGEPGIGLDQSKLWVDTDNYLNSLESKPTMIQSMARLN